MKQLRQLIQSILNEQNNRDLFNKETASISGFESEDEWYGISGELDKEKAKKKITGMMSTANVAKKAFKKYADTSFIKSLVFVHWAEDEYQMLDDITNPNVTNTEISCCAYLPTNVPKVGAFGKYGTIISGDVNILANSMNSIYTGYLSQYDQAGHESGEKGFEAFVQDDIVLSKEDWDPELIGGQNHSEALMDKFWEPMGIILPDNEVQDILDELGVMVNDLGIDALDAIYYDDFTINGKQLLEWLPEIGAEI